MERKRANDERAKQRLEQIGTGERHERIRTYNFLQVRTSNISIIGGANCWKKPWAII